MKYHRHHVIAVVITLFAVLVCLGIYGLGLQKGLEHRAYDMRVRMTRWFGLGHANPTGQVIVVGIDERSIITEKPLLFIYDDIGRFVRRMDEFGARTVGLDVILVHKQSDKLKNAASAFMSGAPDKGKGDYGRIMEEVGERLDRSALEPIMAVSERMNIVQVVHGDLVPFYYGVSPFIKNMTLAEASLTDGELTVNDGVIRRQAVNSGGRPDFTSALFTLATGRRYGGKQVYVNYSMTEAVPFYCLDDVMKGRIDGAAFKGRTVILGYVSGYEDIHATPLRRDVTPRCMTKSSTPPRTGSGRMPGPLIHGIMLETMLTGTSLREAPFAVNAAILVFLTALSLMAITFLRPLFAVIIVAAIALCFCVINLLMFASGSYLHLFPQAITPLLTAVLIYPYRYFVEERTRRKVEKVFGYYVDTNVLAGILEKDTEMLLAGEARSICIMFLDVRNFTALSTTRTAREMVGFLNFFFGSITETIQRNKGFVNKFIGDGILAFYMTGDNPVADAVSAALEIHRDTRRLNTEGRFREFIGDWTVNVGIGIHYGEVILGNIGSERKMDFTIIGEHVNMASRIEGLTKEAGVGLLVSSEARASAGDAFAWRTVGEFAVKGVDQPISLYTVEET